tara:strand:+ start:1437 stop:2183 length:747 start_codon:yes stop_codon:yes gene_type:complete
MNALQQAVISKLKDDAEYYNGIGKNYLSNSDISTLLTNPKDFRTPREDNKNFVYGRYFHQLILEPTKAKDFLICEASSRNTKLYKEFVVENNIEVALLEKEAKETEELVDTLLSSMDFAMEIQQDTNKYEVPMITEIGGVLWKGKADIITHNKIIDIKTTSNLDAFEYNAKWKYFYCSQAYIYEKLFNKPMVFMVIEKGSGQLGWFECGADFLALGEQKVNEAIEVYQNYYGDQASKNIKNHYIKKTL